MTAIKSMQHVFHRMLATGIFPLFVLFLANCGMHVPKVDAQQSRLASDSQAPDKSRGSEISEGAERDAADRRLSESEPRATAVFAGGCFWCVESDIEHASGVVNVISGYTGGKASQPNYHNYFRSGHREAVFVTYDPSQIAYAGLVEYFIKHIDPTDRSGSFKDRGRQYSPAIYYENDMEKAEAERVIAAIDATRIYRRNIGVELIERSTFWPAEDYHQDYYEKNPTKYRFYRAESGRDEFVLRHWGQRAGILEIVGAFPQDSKVQSSAGEKLKQEAKDKPWDKFEKPSLTELRKKLNSIQYKVTQQEGTEPAFKNAYWKNKATGIYVDIVSGEPLFLSSDKFESGTGWPSFVKPIDSKYIVYKEDRGLFTVRTEVRSRSGDSHLGHVFDDGPADRGGKRYCMNSAAMRFIAKADMEKEGYADYVPMLDK